MKRVVLLLAVLGLFAPSSSARAQGIQTGTITGTVQSADGLSLPGVTVTVSSPVLQGQRSATTDVNGVYLIHGLPAGTYAVSFDMPSFKAAKKENVEVNVGSTVDVPQTMALAGVAETVNVTGDSPKPMALTVPTISQVYTKAEVDALPVGRVPNQIADLSPGLTSNTSNAGQLAISGATSFDNVFMMNGVDINDNLFGTANNLFIEDAIQQTNILTCGISAEYGRFSGGVVNVITKSGGNTFSGSFRENLNNTAWIEETPRQKQANIVNPNLLSKSSEGTFGGPIMRDRLWFFSAGRYEPSDTNLTFILSDQAAIRHDVNKRGEIKFTGTPAMGHTISGD